MKHKPKIGSKWKPKYINIAANTVTDIRYGVMFPEILYVIYERKYSSGKVYKELPLALEVWFSRNRPNET